MIMIDQAMKGSQKYALTGGGRYGPETIASAISIISSRLWPHFTSEVIRTVLISSNLYIRIYNL